MPNLVVEPHDINRRDDSGLQMWLTGEMRYQHYFGRPNWYSLARDNHRYCKKITVDGNFIVIFTETNDLPLIFSPMVEKQNETGDFFLGGGGWVWNLLLISMEINHESN